MAQAVLNGSMVVPWYRQKWPWLLMSLPATAVVAGFATLYLAFKSDDGLVAQDYYTQGLAINRVLDRQDRATQMGLTAELQQTGSQFLLSLKSARELSLPEQIRLTLLNPVRAGEDQVVVLKREGEHYVGAVPAVRNGRWNVSLEDEGQVWQLYTETKFPLDKVAKLVP